MHSCPHHLAHQHQFICSAAGCSEPGPLAFCMASPISLQTLWPRHARALQCPMIRVAFFPDWTLLVWVVLNICYTLSFVPGFSCQWSEFPYSMPLTHPKVKMDGHLKFLPRIKIKGKSQGVPPSVLVRCMWLEYHVLAPSSLLFKRKYPQHHFLGFSKPITLAIFLGSTSSYFYKD